ncbi:MAG: hypothetical protein WB777_17375 [Mycobacterium sp.]
MDAKLAVYKAIADRAPKTGSSAAVAELAYAYAALEGARVGVLPGSPPSDKK